MKNKNSEMANLRLSALIFLTLILFVSSCVDTDEIKVKVDLVTECKKKEDGHLKHDGIFIRTSGNIEYNITQKEFLEMFNENDTVWISYYIKNEKLKVLDSSIDRESLKDGLEQVKYTNISYVSFYLVILAIIVLTVVLGRFVFYRFFKQREE